MAPPPEQQKKPDPNTRLPRKKSAPGTQDRVSQQLEGQRKAEGLAGEKVSQELSNLEKTRQGIEASMAQAYANIGLIPYTKQQIEAQIGFIEVQKTDVAAAARIKQLQIPGEEAASEIAVMVRDAIRTGKTYVPILTEAKLLEKQAAKFRAEGKDSLAEQLENVASLKKQAAYEGMQSDFTSVEAAMEIFSNMMGRAADPLFGPEGRILFNINSNTAQPPQRRIRQEQ